VGVPVLFLIIGFVAVWLSLLWEDAVRCTHSARKLGSLALVVVTGRSRNMFAAIARLVNRCLVLCSICWQRCKDPIIRTGVWLCCHCVGNNDIDQSATTIRNDSRLQYDSAIYRVHDHHHFAESDIVVGDMQYRDDNSDSAGENERDIAEEYLVVDNPISFLDPRIHSASSPVRLHVPTGKLLLQHEQQDSIDQQHPLISSSIVSSDLNAVRSCAVTRQINDMECGESATQLWRVDGGSNCSSSGRTSQQLHWEQLSTEQASYHWELANRSLLSRRQHQHNHMVGEALQQNLSTTLTEISSSTPQLVCQRGRASLVVDVDRVYEASLCAGDIELSRGGEVSGQFVHSGGENDDVRMGDSSRNAPNVAASKEVWTSSATKPPTTSGTMLSKLVEAVSTTVTTSKTKSKTRAAKKVKKKKLAIRALPSSFLRQQGTSCMLDHEGSQDDGVATADSNPPASHHMSTRLAVVGQHLWRFLRRAPLPNTRKADEELFTEVRLRAFDVQQAVITVETQENPLKMLHCDKGSVGREAIDLNYLLMTHEHTEANELPSSIISAISHNVKESAESDP
jgi:hypothetical protein